MKKLPVLISSALLTTSLSVITLPAHSALPIEVSGQTLPSLAPMLEKTMPAVVSISVQGTHEIKSNVPEAFRRFFGNRQPQAQERPFKGVGSGVVINADEGYIVTNNHVVDNADDITITLTDGRQLKAKKIGSDESSDIALLQVEAKKLTELKIADSDALRVGDFTVAIGNPFGLGQTVTSGIVSALGRSGLNIENYEDFIQTDAAINSGNSGGALVNLRGELIGINTAIIGPGGGNVGIGFAIPSNMMENLINQIIEFGEIRRGKLGVSGRSVNSDIAEAMELETNQGGFVEQVMTDSAAEKAGIEAGDVITKINGKKIRTFEELRGKIGSLGAGKKVKLTVIRDGKQKTFTATLQKAENTNIAAENIHDMLDGAKLENSSKIDGVEVTNIEENTKAQAIGLRKGDIITGVNKTRTNNIAELRSFFKDNKGVFALNIIRGNSSLYLMIR